MADPVWLCCENDAGVLTAVEKLNVFEKTDLVVGDLYDDSHDDAHLTFCIERFFDDDKSDTALTSSEQVEEMVSSSEGPNSDTGSSRAIVRDGDAEMENMRSLGPGSVFGARYFTGVCIKF